MSELLTGLYVDLYTLSKSSHSMIFILKKTPNKSGQILQTDLERNCLPTTCFPPAAQDGPPDQHLLQRRQAPLADGQRGRGPGRRCVPPGHVWHRGLVAHLGTAKKKKSKKLPTFSGAEGLVCFLRV